MGSQTPRDRLKTFATFALIVAVAIGLPRVGQRVVVAYGGAAMVWSYVLAAAFALAALGCFWRRPFAPRVIPWTAASAALLVVTTRQMTLDLPAAPELFTLPLALWLASFAFTFRFARAVFFVLFAVSLLLVRSALLQPETMPAQFQLGFFAAALFSGSIVCHRGVRGDGGLGALLGCALGATVACLLPIPYVASDAVYRERNLYGVISIDDHGDLIDGTALAGSPSSLLAYAHGSGVDWALQALRARGRPLTIGALGIGAGTLAALAAAGDELRFYEVNPILRRLAVERFHHIADSKARVTIVPGDPRASLAADLDASFDLMVVDAFFSDAIPLHLLTEEAFDTYLRRLHEGGVIAVNLSSRHLNLRPQMLALAKRFGLSLAILERGGKEPSTWALLAADAAVLGNPAIVMHQTPLGHLSPEFRLWKDGSSSIWSSFLPATGHGVR